MTHLSGEPGVPWVETSAAGSEAGGGASASDGVGSAEAAAAGNLRKGVFRDVARACLAAKKGLCMADKITLQKNMARIVV